MKRKREMISKAEEICPAMMRFMNYNLIAIVQNTSGAYPGFKDD